MRSALAALSLVAGVLPAAAAGDPAALYLGEETQVRAALGDGPAQFPARLFPCANCHGRDGLGGGEGTLRAPRIVPLPGKAGLSAQDILRAAADGIEPDGRILDRAMPRYSLTTDDAVALAAWLAERPAREGRGVTATEVRMILPFDPRTEGIAGPFADGFADAMAGVRPWGRTVVLVPVAWGADAPTVPAIASVGAALPDTADRAVLANLDLIDIAPLHPVDTMSADAAPLCATRPEAIRALAGVLPRGTRVAVIAQGGTTAHAADAALTAAGLRVVPVDQTPDAALLLSDVPERRATAAGLPHVLGFRDQIDAPAVQQLIASGTRRISLVDACGTLTGDLTGAARARRLGELAGERVGTALQAAGRNLSRARLVEALAGTGSAAQPTIHDWKDGS